MDAASADLSKGRSRLAAVRAWALPVFLIALGVIVTVALQRSRTAAPFDWVEMHGQGPAKLGPIIDASGREVALDTFRGKTVILNLWAPWCVPCLQEMPSLDRLAQRLDEKDYAVVAVTQDPVGDSPSKRTFDKMGLSRLKLYLDPAGKLKTDVGARGFPTTLILGPDGAPLAYREGETAWDSLEVMAKVDGLAARVRRAE